VFDIPPNQSRSAEADILRAVFEELRASGELNPAPGFYDRVCSRIEEISRQSILAVDRSADDPIFSSASPQEQRDAVLTQIVTYRKPN
jgi:hypothetical protein